MDPSGHLSADCPAPIVELVGDAVMVAGSSAHNLAVGDADGGGVPVGVAGSRDARADRWINARWISDRWIVDRWDSPDAAAVAAVNQSALATHLGGPTVAISIMADGAGGPDSAASGPASWVALERSGSWPGNMVEHHPEPAALAAGLGRSLHALHHLDPTTVSADLKLCHGEGWEGVAQQVESRLDANNFEPRELREPYRRYGPEQLWEMFRGARPQQEDLVINHGQFLPSNVLVSGGETGGLLGLSSMRLADRHFDLARMHLAIHELLGGEAVFAFYDAYGSEPNLIAIDHYIFAHTLLVQEAR